MKPAVFLDRDGTVCEEMGYLNDESRMRVFPFSGRAIRRLNEAGYEVIIVTNQGGVARGYFPESFLGKVHRKLRRELARSGARLSGIFYCPHHPAGEVAPYAVQCDCRKPSPGLVKIAARKFGLDLERSFVVGDKIVDVELARRVGARGILVETGYGRGEVRFRRKTWTVQPDYIARDLAGAARWILAQHSSEGPA